MGTFAVPPWKHDLASFRAGTQVGVNADTLQMMLGRAQPVYTYIPGRAPAPPIAIAMGIAVDAGDTPSTPTHTHIDENRRLTASKAVASSSRISPLVTVTALLPPPPPPSSASTASAAAAKGVGLVRVQLAARGVHSSTHGNVVDDAAIAEELQAQGGHVGRTVNRLKQRAERSDEAQA